MHKDIIKLVAKVVDVGGIFGKKQEKFPNMPPPTDFPEPSSPTANVMNMQQQGLNNNQIMQNMNQQGYTSQEINDAMNMAEVKGAVDQRPIQGAPMPPPQAQGGMPQPPQFSQGMVSNDERIEELAEAIIDEKWKELSKNIDKIIDWKEKTEARVQSLINDFNEMKKSFDSLHNAILGKVSEYDNNIISLGSEIKAMEKVFQKLLPTFTDNVNELSRITGKIKKK